MARWWELAIPAAAALAGGWVGAQALGRHALKLFERQRVKAEQDQLESRAWESAVGVRDLLLEKLSLFDRTVDLRHDPEGWIPDDFREAPGWIADVRRLRGLLLPLPDSAARAHLQLVADLLWWITPVAAAAREAEEAVGDEICEFGLSAVGQYMRHEPVGDEPDQIRTYRRSMEKAQERNRREYEEYVATKRQQRAAATPPAQ